MDPYLGDEKAGGSSFDPLELLRLFWRRKWLFIIPFILCLTMAWVAIKVMTPIFFSAGQIRVVHETTNSRLISDGGSRYGRYRNMDHDTMVNIETIVTGPKFLEQVVRELDLHQMWMGIESTAPGTAGAVSPREASAVRSAARALQRRIRVDQDGTHLFSLGIRDPNPQTAFALARVVLDKFLEEERANRMAPRTTTRDFLENQREIYQEDLDSAETALTEYQREMLSASLAGNPINYQNLTAAETALNRLREQFVSGDVNEISRLERQAQNVLPTLPPVTTFSQNTEIVPVFRELTDLEFDRHLSGGMSAGSRGFDQQNELGSLRLHLSSLIEGQLQRLYPQMGQIDRGKVAGYFYFMIYRQIHQRIIDRLNQNITEFRDFTTMQPEQSAELTRLQNDVTSARDMLAQIEREITQQTMSLEASLSEIGYRIEVRKDPTLPRSPIEPNKVKLAFMGFILSVALGGGLVVLAILLDRSFNSVPEIERVLGLPVIGTLPVIQDDHFERRRKLRFLKWISIVVMILAVAAVGLLVVYPRLS